MPETFMDVPPGLPDPVGSISLLLEPMFEADFEPVSCGFRPQRRAQDAVAAIHATGTRNCHWVFEADIQACFGELKHSAVM